MNNDCNKPACQILKPHEHVLGGVFFPAQRLLKEKDKEIETLKASLQVSNIELAIYKEAIERMPLESIKAFIASMASVRDELEDALQMVGLGRTKSSDPDWPSG